MFQERAFLKDLTKERAKLQAAGYKLQADLFRRWKLFRKAAGYWQNLTA